MMAMMRIMDVTLDQKQVKQAIEDYVSRKMNDDTLAFQAEYSELNDRRVQVVVTKKRIRKPRKSKEQRDMAVEAHESELRG